MKNIPKVKISRHEVIIEWANRVDKLWERFLILHKEGHLPHVSNEDIENHLRDNLPYKNPIIPNK